jgi:HK97 family phage major capsid protein
MGATFEVKALQEQYRTADTEANAFARQLESTGKPPTETELARWEKLIEERQGYQRLIEMKAKEDDLAEFRNRFSNGQGVVTGLQPGQARIEGIVPAGETIIEMKAGRDGRFSSVFEQYGDGIFSDKQLAHINTTREYKAALGHYLRAPEGVRGGQLSAIELKALQEGLDPLGGYLVPEDILNQMLSRMIAPMRINALCNHVQTSRDSVIIPKVNYLAETDTIANVYDSPVRVTWTGEIPASSMAMAASDPLFGLTRIPVFTAMISLRLTLDMLEDSAFPIAGFVSEKFTNTTKILYDDKILNGTGVSQPKGLLINPQAAGTLSDQEPSYVVTGNATQLTWDGLEDLAYSLPEQYDDGAQMVFNKNNTARAIAGLVDGQGRPFWGMGYQDSGFSERSLGRPLLGYGVTLNALMPNVSTSTYPIILGNFKGYTVVDRVGFSVRQLGELYAETNQVVLLGRLRFGGLATEPWQFRIQYVHT